jgi:hypothetical protein
MRHRHPTLPFMPSEGRYCASGMGRLGTAGPAQEGVGTMGWTGATGLRTFCAAGIHFPTERRDGEEDR